MNANEVDILLADDSQDDIDLTLHALRAENLANHVFVARDGEEALDFLFCTGPHVARSFDHPPKAGSSGPEDAESGRDASFWSRSRATREPKPSRLS